MRIGVEDLGPGVADDSSAISAFAGESPGGGDSQMASVAEAAESRSEATRAGDGLRKDNKRWRHRYETGKRTRSCGHGAMMMRLQTASCPARGLSELKLREGWRREAVSEAGCFDDAGPGQMAKFGAWRTAEELERTESEQTGPGIGVSRRSHGPAARGGQQSFVSPSQAVMSRVAGGCHVHGLTKKVGGARRNVSLHIPTEPAAETGLAPSVAL